MTLLINIDVPDIDRGIAFYTQAFGLAVSRRLGEDAAELSGWPVPVYLLQKEPGSVGAGSDSRSYERHWTPVHLDIVVDDMDAALSRAREAGAVVEQDVQTAVWGQMASLADPFGHGLCLIKFLNRGYGEIADQ